MYGVRNSSWNPTLFVFPNKDYLKKVERKILIVREFLFGNVQIGVMSQGLIFKASCIELGTPHETRSCLHYQVKIQVWEWGRKRFREERDWCKIPYTNLCCVFLLCLMLLSLYVPLFFVFSLCLCRVCVHFSLFVSQLSFFLFFLPFSPLFACWRLFIYREVWETVPSFFVTQLTG